MSREREVQLEFIRRCQDHLGGITRSALARRAGVSPSTLNKFVKTNGSGGRDPGHLLSYRTMVSLARTAGVPAPGENAGLLDGAERDLMHAFARLPAAQRRHLFQLVMSMLRSGGQA